MHNKWKHWTGDTPSVNKPSIQGLCTVPHTPLYHQELQTSPDGPLGKLLLSAPISLIPSFPNMTPGMAKVVLNPFVFVTSQ